jgi:hypothetical protein
MRSIEKETMESEIFRRMAPRWNWVEMLFRIDSNLGVRRLRISSDKSFIAAFFIAFLFFYLEIIELPKNSVISTDELWGNPDDSSFF